MKSEPGPPMTLGAAATAGVCLIVSVQGVRHSEPSAINKFPAEWYWISKAATT
jgi:hypothetical protein